MLTFAVSLNVGSMGQRTFDEATMTQLNDFKTKCLDQDTTSVAELATGGEVTFMPPYFFYIDN
jgi:hypothetical protein